MFVKKRRERLSITYIFIVLLVPGLKFPLLLDLIAHLAKNWCFSSLCSGQSDCFPLV